MAVIGACVLIDKEFWIAAVCGGNVAKQPRGEGTMHIEPGIVVGTAKLALGYATAAAAIGYSAKLAYDMAKKGGGV